MDRVTETVKREIKKQDCRFLGASLAPLLSRFNKANSDFLLSSERYYKWKWG